MLTERKSDPYFLTATPNTRRKRRLRKQKTTLARQVSGSDNVSQSSSFYQILVSTKSAVQGIGYNFTKYLFDDSRPLVVDENSNQRVWLLGSPKESTSEFYISWEGIHRMTYRKRWPEPIMNRRIMVEYDSDTGWGCTIRSCQMLVAHALVRLQYPNSQLESLFEDVSSSLFSIHRFISSQAVIQAGEWFGPTSVSLALKRLLESKEGRCVGVGILVSVDGRISTEEVLEQSVDGQRASSSLGSSSNNVTPAPRLGDDSYEACGGRANSWELCNPNEGMLASSVSSASCFEPSPRSGFLRIPDSTPQEFWLIEENSPSDESEVEIVANHGSAWEKPVLVIVAMRLSPDSEMSRSQTSSLLSYMTVPSFVGFLGGPERRCHYIVGLVEEAIDADNVYEYTLLSVDPHIVQDAVVDSSRGSRPFSNAANPSRVSPSYLCPSVAVGFLLRCQEDLDQLKSLRGFIEVTDQHSADPLSPVVVL